ncbi:MAG: hypothetical protein ACE5DS_04150 [Kiloniellaceae bacterium]
MDLSEAEVRNNLAYYETLRTLSGHAKAAAVFRRQGTGIPAPANTGNP